MEIHLIYASKCWSCPIHGEVPASELLTAEAMVERLTTQRDQWKEAAEWLYGWSDREQRIAAANHFEVLKNYP